MIIDLVVYGTLKVLSFVLGWIPGLPDALIEFTYLALETLRDVLDSGARGLLFILHPALRGVALTTLPLMLVFLGAGIVRRLVGALTGR